MAVCTEPFVTTEVPPVVGTRVLIVEKDRIVRELLEAALEAVGRRIDAATNCHEALSLAAAGPAVDVALVERVLPDGCGLVLTGNLKQQDSNTEVLVMSAAPSLEAVIEAVEAGATDFVAKPFDDINQLAIRVGAAEERARLRRDGKWLHNELVESEERYRKLFEAIPDAVLVVDTSAGRIVDANFAACTMYGYSREELIGLAAERLLEPPHSTPTSEALSVSELPGVLRRKDRRRDGVSLDVELVVGAFHSQGGDVRVEIVREIGERLRAQEAQRKLEEQLLQAQKMEALGQLAGGIAHDFNNLLAIILNYGDFVARGLKRERSPEGDAELEADVSELLKAATSAASLTRQLLAFSRRELIQPDVLDVNTVITSLESLLRRTLGPEVELCTKLGKRLRRVRIDRGQLEASIVNLAVNARDAMPLGGRLTISTRQGTSRDSGAPSEPIVEIEIEDTGVGIASDILDHIFDPFFTTKSRDKGTGLGLATVKGIVEQAGGTVTVQTALGRGTSFRLQLPATSQQPERKPQLKRRTAEPSRSETILVVDDEPAVRRATVRILDAAGYLVLSASSSNEAVQLFGEGGPHINLVVTDVLMAGLRGDELVTQLRKTRPHLKTVFVTGYAATAFVDASAPAAERTVLPKPFSRARLLEVVRSTLDGQ